MINWIVPSDTNNLPSHSKLVLGFYADTGRVKSLRYNNGHWLLWDYTGNEIPGEKITPDYWAEVPTYTQAQSISFNNETYGEIPQSGSMCLCGNPYAVHRGPRSCAYGGFTWIQTIPTPAIKSYRRCLCISCHAPMTHAQWSQSPLCTACGPMYLQPTLAVHLL